MRMNRRIMLTVASALVAAALLASCGKSGESRHASGHGGHDEPNAAGESGLQASFAFAAGRAAANEETELTIRITDRQGIPVDKYEVNHEKLLHLIVVDHDLAYFDHIHPDYRGDGEFAVTTAFPSGGQYKVFADFIPEGGKNLTLSEWVTVEGEEAAHVELKQDERLVRSTDGKEIELALDEVKPGKDVKLSFTIRDDKTKEAIDDLEPYLGAVGHVVILSADAEQYLHVHPIDEKATGPVAEFSTSFPHAGLYKIWAQFKHEGQVITAPYVVNVKS
ncbi:hypothetical protein B0G52_103264 [Cohnella sp. SGD-V74]|nr:hypothetical protein B0G52_103264 [Cohnella sp. SGD-V74]